MLVIDEIHCLWGSGDAPVTVDVYMAGEGVGAACKALVSSF